MGYKEKTQQLLEALNEATRENPDDAYDIMVSALYDFDNSPEATSDTKLKSGDIVYTQDGTQYYFDHVAGDHGYVSPILIVQTTNYQGDDFDEHEEVADHMIPVLLDHLSKTPWIKKIHEETAAAIEEKEQILSEVNLKIGAAHTELRVGENSLKAKYLELNMEAAAITRKYQWMRDFRRMVGDDKVIFLSVDGAIPSDVSAPDKLELKINDKGTYDYIIPFDYEDEDKVVSFSTENQRDNYIRRVHSEQLSEMSEETEIRWQMRWNFLPLSDKAQIYLGIDNTRKKAKKQAKTAKALVTAQEAFDQCH